FVQCSFQIEVQQDGDQFIPLPSPYQARSFFAGCLLSLELSTNPLPLSIDFRSAPCYARKSTKLAKGGYLRFKNRRQTATRTTRSPHVCYQNSQAVRRSGRNTKPPDRFGNFPQDPSKEDEDGLQSDGQDNEDR
ncbi:hypothetical protein CLAIMM_00387, partial [Cladophialophora immunda]